MPMTDGLKKCKDRAMRISGSDSKGGYGYDKDKDDMTKGSYMNEDMADEKNMYEEKGSTAGCKCPGCMNCKKMGGCTKNMCVGHKEYNNEEKRMYSDKERMKLADEGMALPDGSYPIKDVEDLKNAIQSYGRAKDKEKAKAHIMKRAKELKAEDLIPENWNEEKTMDFAEFQLLKEQLNTLRVALD
jgi:hypothetical protein